MSGPLHTCSALRVTLQVAWRGALFLLAFASIGAVFFVPLASVLSRWSETNPVRAQLYADSAGAVAVLAATWVMTRFIDRRAFRTIGLVTRNVSRDVSAGLAVGASWLVLSVAGLWALGWASFESPTAFSAQRLGVATLSVLLNVLTQQLLLCGYVFQTILARAGFRVALMGSAALFAAVHAAGFQGAWLPALNVFGAAVLFVLAYRASGNLWFPVAVHFAWNLLLGPVLGLTVSGSGALGLGWKAFAVEGPTALTGGGFGIEGGLVVTATTALFIVGLARLRQRWHA